MRIKHLKINGNTITASDAENKKIVKNFYTVFSFIKAVKYNDNEAIVVFQTGNGEELPRYGNTGKDLYYYHLVVNGDSTTVKRYEYLYDNCEKIKIQKIIKLMLQSFQNIEFMSHVKLELENLEDLFYIKIEIIGMNSISIILRQKLLEILFLQDLKNH